MRNKIYDCITFFQENLQFELRFNTVDKSFFDHNSQLLIDANTNDLKKRHI